MSCLFGRLSPYRSFCCTWWGWFWTRRSSKYKTTHKIRYKAPLVAAVSMESLTFLLTGTVWLSSRIVSEVLFSEEKHNPEQKLITIGKARQWFRGSTKHNRSLERMGREFQTFYCWKSDYFCNLKDIIFPDWLSQSSSLYSRYNCKEKHTKIYQPHKCVQATEYFHLHHAPYETVRHFRGFGPNGGSRASDQNHPHSSIVFLPAQSQLPFYKWDFFWITHSQNYSIHPSSETTHPILGCGGGVQTWYRRLQVQGREQAGVGH